MRAFLGSSGVRWLVISVLVVLQGCSLARVDDNLPYGVLNNNDLALVGEGLPTYLLIVDGLLETWPDNEGLLQSGAGLYAAYAGLYVQDQERARKLVEKSLDYALRAACAHDRDLCQLRTMNIGEFEGLMEKQKQKDVPVLYVVGTSWAGYIQQHTSDWAVIAELARVRMLMERVIALDEGYEFGQAHMYMGVLNSLLPASLGGKPELARTHFERAIELGDGQNLYAKVLYAEKYARLMFDQALHDRLLNEVLAAPAEVHGLTLQNTYAHKEARRLLETSAEYFE